VTSYRAEVRNAQAAARLGLPVLRFHARGHGDSAGDFADVTLASLVDDALAAAACARDLSGSRRVAWLGVRFGALVAAEAVRREGDAAALVLWEPVHRPPEYFRSMLRGMLYSQVAQGRRPDASVDDLIGAIAREGRIDVHGYYLHRALFDSARDADLAASLSAWAGPTLLCQVQVRQRLWSPHAALAHALAGRGVKVATAQVHAEPGWHFVSNPPWLGEGLVERTAEWLDALA
jgi:hypothetical protein